MIALYIFGGLLLLLLLPIGARFRFCGEGRLVVRYLGVPIFRFDSSKEKKPRKVRKKAAETAAEKRKQPSEKNPFLEEITSRLTSDGVSAVLEYFAALARLFGGMMHRLLCTLHFGRSTVTVTVGGSDAAEVALKYGKVCGPIVSAAALVAANFHTRRLSVTVNPDFFCETDKVSVDIRVYAIPLVLLWAIVRTALAYIGMKIKLSKESEER